MNFEEWAKGYFGEGLFPPDGFKDGWEAATKAEREACAKVCEYIRDNEMITDGGREIADFFVYAIRRRSNANGKATERSEGRVDHNVGRQILEKAMNTAPPPLPKKPPAAFHHSRGFELYDRLAMDLHAMAYAEPMLKEIETLRRHIADIGEAMRTKANNNPANECIDPDADTIEHHPKRQQLEQQVTELTAERDAAMKDADRWRTVELLMFLGNVELNQDEDGGYKILLFPAENIVDQGWEGNSPEQAVDAVKCYGQPEKQAETETTVPAIVFYPAGSLGEAIEIEGGAA